jgi:hypothetical protein
VPRPGAEKKIHKKLRPFAYATPIADAAPEAKLNFIPVMIPAAARKLYADLEKNLEITVRGELIQALEMGVMRGKLLQITSGAIYYGKGSDKDWVPIHDAKIDALAELVEELQGSQLLIMFRFKHEQERILKRFGRICTDINGLDKWLSGSKQLLSVHPASAAHGLNLHEGGASDQCWFTLPDSQELWEQGNRRLARKGQTQEVVANVLTVQGTKEESIARDLKIHGNLQDALMASAMTKGDNL